MRWLLITTSPELNPGDQFIRLGVERLIRAVDPVPVFDYLAKDSGADLERRREFDRAVLCGMPLFWNNRTSVCQDVGWWGELIRGWPSEDKRKFLVLGAGAANGVEMRDSEQYLEAIKWVIGRAWAMTTRHTVIDWPHVMDSICPAAFAVPPAVANWHPFPRLVNLMPAGAHDEHFDPVEAETWKRRLPEVAAWAKANGFVPVVHNAEEQVLAGRLGFTNSLWPHSPEAYLRLYSQAQVYVGNRLHGAMAAASAGAKTCAIGYDSRVRMLDRFNVLTLNPSEANLPTLEAFLEMGHCPDFVFHLIRTEFARNLNLVARFALPA